MVHPTETKENALKLSDQFGLQQASEMTGIKKGTIAYWRYMRNCENGCVKPRADRGALLIKKIDKNIADLKAAKKLLKKVFDAMETII